MFVTRAEAGVQGPVPPGEDTGFPLRIESGKGFTGMTDAVFSVLQLVLELVECGLKQHYEAI